MLNQGTINEYKVNSPVIKRTPRSPAHFIVNVTGIKHQVPMDIRVGLRQKPTFPVLALVGVRHITYYPMIIRILIRTDPVLVILDRDRKIRASLPGVAWNYTRRINEATDISLSVPRQVVDEYIPPGHDLEDFFRKNKAQYAEIASFIQVFSGSTLKASGKIARRTLGELVEIQAFTEEILLEGNLTPAQYGKVYDGWDLAYVARDILDGWQSIRVKDKSQWQAYMADSSDVDLDTEPGVVMLAKSGGQYRPSGYITLQFDSGEVRDFLRWDRIRWSADSEDPVKTTIQYSTNGTSWSSEFDGGIPEEVGIVPSNATSDSMYIRINLYTDDTESEDPDGNPVGVTPFVFAVELIARTEGDLVEGNIPATSGVVVKGIDADHASAFQVLLSACEQAGWEFQVVNGALSIAESLGADRTKDFVLRAGTNMEITSLGDDDEELCNVLTAYSPGRGINRMELTLRDDVSVAEFGEYPKAVEFEAETLTELQNKAEEYLEEHSNPKTNFEIFAAFDFEHEPEYGLGDKVRVADPDTGIVTATRIMSETRQFGDSGLSVHLELGKAGLNLQRILERKPAKETVEPETPTGVYAKSIIAGIVAGCSMPKGDWGYTECHMSPFRGFIPTTSTIKARGRQTRFEITGLEMGKRYYIKLVHVSSLGNPSIPSMEISAVASFVPVDDWSDQDPPPIPSGLTLSTGLEYVGQITWSRIVATWTATPDTAYYLVRYRRTGQEWQESPTTSNSQNLTPLAGNVAYEVQVRSVGPVGNASNWSSSKTITTAKDTSAPAKPVFLESGGIVKGIYVVLQTPTEADWDGFEIHVSDSGAGFTPSPSTLKAKGRQTRYEITGLVPGRTYYVKAIAYDTSGNKSAPAY